MTCWGVWEQRGGAGKEAVGRALGQARGRRWARSPLLLLTVTGRLGRWLSQEGTWRTLALSLAAEWSSVSSGAKVHRLARGCHGPLCCFYWGFTETKPIIDEDQKCRARGRVQGQRGTGTEQLERGRCPGHSCAAALLGAGVASPAAGDLSEWLLLRPASSRG